MFGSIPATFNDFQSANTIAEAYTKVTNDEWTVIKKTVNVDIGKFKTYYKPCMITAYNYDVKAEGWIIADD